MSAFHCLSQIRTAVSGYLRSMKKDEHHLPPLIILICQHYFKTVFDSVIMDRNEQLKLIDILMKNVKLGKDENKTKIDFNLLYRMSKHGRKPSIFHKYCNQKER
eukprot:724916_1